MGARRPLLDHRPGGTGGPAPAGSHPGWPGRHWLGNYGERYEPGLRAVRAAGTRCPVSAGAVSSPAVAAGLLAEGYVALLIGTALLRAPSVESWLREFDACRASTRAPIPVPAPATGTTAQAGPVAEAEGAPA